MATTRFDVIPFADHHCHSWLRGWQAQSIDEFRSCFTESASTIVIREHVVHSLPYIRALHALAGLLGCPDTEEAVLAERGGMGERQYVKRLFQRANICVMLLDDGFPPADRSLTREQIEAATGIKTGRVIRIETLAEEQLRVALPFREAVGRFDGVTGAIEESGAVGLKTIAAYRSGLRLGPVSWKVAEAAWDRELQHAPRSERVRIEAKPLIDFFALRALEHAADQKVAFQIHAGAGDPDLDLLEANPLHLRWILENQRFQGSRIVLLHGAHPYTREGAYLASVYPNVFLDISTALPPLGLREIESALQEAIAIAPVSKLLLSSDSARIPEHHVLGAQVARQALSLVLEESRYRLELDEVEELRFAEQILWGTARSIYGDIVAPRGELTAREVDRRPSDTTRA
jgi:hypothetical protein